MQNVADMAIGDGGARTITKPRAVLPRIAASAECWLHVHLGMLGSRPNLINNAARNACRRWYAKSPNNAQWGG